MTTTADDNMTRPIGSLVWAYGQHLNRKRLIDEFRAAGDTPPRAITDKEAEMGTAYSAALQLRHKELREYARLYGVTLDEMDGKPLDTWRGLVTFALPLIACRIERARVGDDAFFNGCLPPGEDDDA